MRIDQDAAYAGDDRWRWAVWIDGSDHELDSIEYVEYTLHPTFKDPVRRIFDRDAKFRLQSAGWGEFEINAHAVAWNGEPRHLRHWLTLELPGPEQPAPRKPPPRPTVLISCAAADASWGQAIQDALSGRGFKAVATDDTLELGKSWQASIASAADDADLVVGVFSDTPSPWVEREVGEALRHDVSVAPIAVGTRASVPGWLKSTHVIDVSNPAELAPAIELLATRYLS